MRKVKKNFKKNSKAREKTTTKSRFEQLLGFMRIACNIVITRFARIIDNFSSEVVKVLVNETAYTSSSLLFGNESRKELKTFRTFFAVKNKNKKYRAYPVK